MRAPFARAGFGAQCCRGCSFFQDDEESNHGGGSTAVILGVILVVLLGVCRDQRRGNNPVSP